MGKAMPIESMYGIYGNIYHQYTPNVNIYTIHGFYGMGKCSFHPGKWVISRDSELMKIAKLVNIATM